MNSLPKAAAIMHEALIAAKDDAKSPLVRIKIKNAIAAAETPEIYAQIYEPHKTISKE